MIPFTFRPNIRVEPDNAGTGYTWGKPAFASNILRCTRPFAEVLRTGQVTWPLCEGVLHIKSQDRVAERWIVSDDREYPSIACLADGRFSDLSGFLNEMGVASLGETHLRCFGPELGVIMKLIDTAAEPDKGSLSTQVHPMAGFSGLPSKHEMWKGTGRVYLGWKQPIQEGVIREAILGNQLESFMNALTLGETDLVQVPGGTVHAIRHDSFLKEWSNTVMGSGNSTDCLKRSTIALYDRTDGKTPRPGKEDLPLALQVLRHAGGFQGGAVSPASPQLKRHVGDGCRLWTLFRTPVVEVESLEISGVTPWDETGRGVPVFLESGAVTLSQNGNTLLQLESGDEGFIPSGCKSLCVVPVGGNATLIRWFRPFPEP